MRVTVIVEEVSPAGEVKTIVRRAAGDHETTTPQAIGAARSLIDSIEQELVIEPARAARAATAKA